MTERIGFLTSSNRGKIYGQAPASALRNQNTKYTGIVLSACLVLALPLCASSWLPQATDPIFGLKYDPTSVQFERLPTDIYSTCTELTNQQWDRRMWIFARTTGADDQYLVVGGFYLKRGSKQETNLAIEADSVGAVIHLKNNHCELIGPAREVFDYRPEEIATTKLKELARDAVCRYSRAFGSKPKFVDTMRRQYVQLDPVKSPVLQEAVSASNTCH